LVCGCHRAVCCVSTYGYRAPPFPAVLPPPASPFPPPLTVRFAWIHRACRCHCVYALTAVVPIRFRSHTIPCWVLSGYLLPFLRYAFATILTTLGYSRLVLQTFSSWTILPAVLVRLLPRLYTTPLPLVTQDCVVPALRFGFITAPGYGLRGFVRRFTVCCFAARWLLWFPVTFWFDSHGVLRSTPFTTVLSFLQLQFWLFGSRFGYRRGSQFFTTATLRTRSLWLVLVPVLRFAVSPVYLYTTAAFIPTPH